VIAITEATLVLGVLRLFNAVIIPNELRGSAIILISNSIFNLAD